MSRTHTKVINYQNLKARGNSAVLVVKLMMACNDLQLANEALSQWGEDQPRNRAYRQSGARMYFVRLQIAHLFEALHIISEVKCDPALSNLIWQCDTRTQESFKCLEQFLQGGTQYQWFQRIVGRVRHNLTFHYDNSGRLIDRAIDDRAGRPVSQYSSITRGSTTYLWYFKAADELLDSVVVRQIWKIPRGRDLRSEADSISDEIHSVTLAFIDFCGEFIWRFCSR
jgi:hypothetical protein